jgi:hypothetical protein
MQLNTNTFAKEACVTAPAFLLFGELLQKQNSVKWAH